VPFSEIKYSSIVLLDKSSHLFPHDTMHVGGDKAVSCR
jgi:hypothetical protein